MTPSPRPIRIGITLGDPCGIGPEITAMALASGGLPSDVVPLVFGQGDLYARACDAAGVPDTLDRAEASACLGEITRPTLVQPNRRFSLDVLPFGRPTPDGGAAQLGFLQAATDALRSGAIQGICTAPVSKEAIHLHLPGFQGHTEFLADAFGLDHVLMLLAGPVLRVAIHTRHLAIADVPKNISREGILRDLKLLSDEASALVGKAARIAVLALNPHAGENGMFGDEEIRVIAPAIQDAKAAGILADGPFAADGFFAREARSPRFDAVLAMYHDQGLVALKMAHFDDGVNVTVGLPQPRTSPDHGVAYDLAGTGKASPKSMAAALDYLVKRLS